MDTKFKKGQIAWNKGMKMSTEFKQKVSRGTKKAMNNLTIRKKISDKNSPHWKGGRRLTTSGYYVLRVNNQEVLEHHLNWCIANHLSWIPKGFMVHHIDCNKLNNDSNNLVLLDLSLHTKLHQELKKRGEFFGK